MSENGEIGETGELGKLIRTRMKTKKPRSWYVRRFMNMIFIVLMLVSATTPVMTFLYFIAVAQIPTETAILYALIHGGLAGGFIFADILHLAVTAAGKKYIYTFVCDSPSKIYFAPLEIIKYIHLDKELLKSVTVVDQKTNKQIKFTSNVHTYLTLVAGGAFAISLWLMPASFEESFPWWKEASPLRWPIPTNVSIGVLVKQLPALIEGHPITVYEVTFCPALIEWRQKRLPWWDPTIESVEKAVVKLGKGLAMEYRMQRDELAKVCRQLINMRVDATQMGKLLASFFISRFLTVFQEEREGALARLSRKFMWALLLIGAVVIAVAGLLLWLQPWA